jgi:hypothetical protein
MGLFGVGGGWVGVGWDANLYNYQNSDSEASNGTEKITSRVVIGGRNLRVQQVYTALVGGSHMLTAPMNKCGAALSNCVADEPFQIEKGHVLIQTTIVLLKMNNFAKFESPSKIVLGTFFGAI